MPHPFLDSDMLFFKIKGVKNTFSDRNCSVALVYGILLGGELDWTVGL
jgi:hypothetical protein